jgi:lantibiotic modifying enzyme
MLKHAPVEGAREEIAVAARTTANRLLQREDYLCCGNFGRIEALLVASRAIPDSPWQKQARQAAMSIVSSSHRNGFHVNGLGERENPSFFQGMSGIGYQLLRLARTELPSVLLLE